MVAHACGPSYLGVEAGGLFWVLEAKAAVSHDYTTGLQPGGQSKTLPKKKKYGNDYHKSQDSVHLWR